MIIWKELLMTTEERKRQYVYVTEFEGGCARAINKTGHIVVVDKKYRLKMDTGYIYLAPKFISDGKVDWENGKIRVMDLATRPAQCPWIFFLDKNLRLTSGRNF